MFDIKVDVEVRKEVISRRSDGTNQAKKRGGGRGGEELRIQEYKSQERDKIEKINVY